MTVNDSVLNVRSLTQSPEHPYSDYNALSVTNGPTTFPPDLAIFMFVGTVTLNMIMLIPCFNTDVMSVTVIVLDIYHTLVSSYKTLNLYPYS